MAGGGRGWRGVTTAAGLLHGRLRRPARRLLRGRAGGGARPARRAVGGGRGERAHAEVVLAAHAIRQAAVVARALAVVRPRRWFGFGFGLGLGVGGSGSGSGSGSG